MTERTTPKPIRVGGMVQAAALIKQGKPVYPPDLQAQGIEGTVKLQAIISKDGVPGSSVFWYSPEWNSQLPTHR